MQVGDFYYLFCENFKKNKIAYSPDLEIFCYLCIIREYFRILLITYLSSSANFTDSIL